MKTQPSYSVVPKGRLKLDEYRGDEVFGRCFMVIKTPQFGDPTEYLVVFSTLGEWCDCPGNVHHGHCKHIGMVHKYLESQHEMDDASSSNDNAPAGPDSSVS